MVHFEFILDNAAHSSIQLLNHIWSQAMHNMPAHQIPQYFQSQQVPSIALTGLVI